MCYGNPDELRQLVIGRHALPKNDLGQMRLRSFYLVLVEATLP